MKSFDVGALRPPGPDAQSRLSAANDLVQRTLAQHGLAPRSGATPEHGGGTLMGNMGNMGTLMSNLPGFGAGAPSHAFGGSAQASAAHGMQAGSFSCDAGQRSYLCHVPEKATQGATGLVVMLHGCTQTPEDFAAGTAMNALADTHGFVVLYPQQSRGNNAQSCWNWFSLGDQRRDRGEPSILAGMTRQIAQDNNVPDDKIFVAGLSAGAAMAVILGETYPDVFSAIGAHSGLPAGAARDVASAFAAMAGNGPEMANPVAGRQTTRAIVFHGTANSTVNPVNGQRIYQNALNRTAAQTLFAETSGTTQGRSYQRKTVTAEDGTDTLDYWVIDGLGHAWSGGRPAGSYTDPKGPDASAEMVRFFFQPTDPQPTGDQKTPDGADQ